MWNILYNLIFLPLFWTTVQVLSLFKDKIRRGVDGREKLFERLAANISRFPSESKRIWIHSSSMGEFEQAKPIILALKKEFPTYKIVVTFFSPSAYEHSLHYPNADVIEYLPFDTQENTKKFIGLVNPEFGIIIRYDVWPNIIWEAKRKNIPLFLVNATIRSNSARLWKIFASIQKLIHNSFTKILTVSQTDKIKFEQLGLSTEVLSVGDTRFDQVVKRAEDAKLKDFIPKNILEGKKFFILAQTWREDEKHTLPALIRLLEEKDELILLIVPHEPNVNKIEELEDEISWMSNIKHTRMSDIWNYKNEKIILVDSVGILTTLYKYVFAAYVGGSFKQGIHNVLEPAVFGLPLFYGPKHTNSQEAIALLKIGASQVINSSEELYYQLSHLLFDSNVIKNRGKFSSDFVNANIGITEKVIEAIKLSLLQK